MKEMKEMKAKVDPRKAGLEVLSIRRTRKEEIILVLKRGGCVCPVLGIGQTSF